MERAELLIMIFERGPRRAAAQRCDFRHIVLTRLRQPFASRTVARVSAGLADRDALRLDALHQFIPGFDERLRALVLQRRAQSIDIEAGLAELGENLFAVTAVRGHQRAD